MKTETQHTPGPWHIATYGEPVKWLSIKHGCETIARIEAIDTPLDGEGKANAELIAQAPTLLAQRDELLVALVDAITELGQLAEAAGRLAEFGSFIDRQHAAIAKAGGKDGGK